MDRARLRVVFGGGKTFSHGLGQNLKCLRRRGMSVLPPDSVAKVFLQHGTQIFRAVRTTIE